MKCYLFCGGTNSRMYPFSLVTDKSLLRLPNGRSMVRQIVLNLIATKGVSISDIVLLCLQKHLPQFQDEFRDIAINFFPLAESVGTARHFYEAIKRFPDSDRYMVHYTDMAIDLDYLDLINKAKAAASANSGIIVVTLARSEYSQAPFDVNFKVFAFDEKPNMLHPVWTGVGIFEKEVFVFLKDIITSAGVGAQPDIAHDLLARLADDKILVALPIDSPHWIDLGTAANYLKVMDNGTV